MTKLGIENTGFAQNLPQQAKKHMHDFIRIYNQLPKNEKEKLIDDFNSKTTSQLCIDKSLQSTIVLIIPVLDINGIKLLSLERNNGNIFLPTTPNFSGSKIDENIKYLENKMFNQSKLDFNLINDTILNKGNRSFLYYYSQLLDIKDFNNLSLINDYSIYNLKLIDENEIPKLHQEVAENIFNNLKIYDKNIKKLKI